MTETVETPAALRDLVASRLRTVAPLADSTAETLADDVLQAIQRGGWRWDETPGQVYVAATLPLGSPPPSFRDDAHISVHQTEAGAQRALNDWALRHGQYRGFAEFNVHPVRIQE